MSRGKTAVRIPHDAYVFIGDGRKAKLFRNDGNALNPSLKTEQVFTTDNPPSREQGSDRPGRAFASVGARRSAMEEADWHALEEQRFVSGIADTLQVLVREKTIEQLVIAAPPRTLAELRRSLHDDVKKRVIAEIDKDLTNQPLNEIERALAAA